MSDDQAAKVLQFPGKTKENPAPAATAPDHAWPEAKAMAMPIPRSTAKKTNVGVGLALLAVIMASVAVNRFAYRAPTAAEGSRQIASANLEIDRDAAWEKLLAERLAKPGSVVTAAHVGRSATLVEQLRFATLEDKYAIAFRPDGRSIAAIGPAATNGGIVIERAEFLRKYGQLFDTAFVTADLKSSDRDGDKVTESYELRDGQGHATVRAFFEVDAQNQLISVRAVQI